MKTRWPATLAILFALAACRPSTRGAVAPEPSPVAGGRLSDPRIAGVALVANNVEIGYALLAPGRVADPDVRAYAERMHTDHASLNATLTDLLARLDLPAEDDPTGIALRDASVPRRARLAGLRGRAFDVAYVDTDIGSHHELLDVVDRLLASPASRRELREYVATLRPAVAAHLAHAEQLRATLAARRQ